MSPYAYFLNDNLKLFCNSIYALLNKTRLDVSLATDYRQIPIELVSLKRNISIYNSAALPTDIIFIQNLVKQSIGCIAHKNFPYFLWSSRANLLGISPNIQQTNNTILIKKQIFSGSDENIETIIFDGYSFYVSSSLGKRAYIKNDEIISHKILNEAIFDFKYISSRNLFAIASNSGLLLYDITNKRISKKIHKGYIYAVELSDNNELYYFAENSLFCYNILTSKTSDLFNFQKFYFLDLRIYSIKHNKNTIICGTSNGLFVYNLETKKAKLLTSYEGKFPGFIMVNDTLKQYRQSQQTDYYHCMDLSPCGNYAACGTDDGKIIIWDLVHEFAIQPIIVSSIKEKITSIAWGYKNNMIAIINNKTLIGVMPKYGINYLYPVIEEDQYSIITANKYSKYGGLYYDRLSLPTDNY